MAIVLQERSKAEEYTVKKDDTLESIAAAKCPKLGWKVLAKYNWGIDIPKEVLRAISERIGVKVADLGKNAIIANPEKMSLLPDTELTSKLKIPKAWGKKDLVVAKTHKINVKSLRPANAVSITELDKWFIPEVEKCVIKYDLEGDGDRATKVYMDIYGSNYCDCSDWNKGLGTYSDPAALIDESLYNHAEAGVKERTDNKLEWAGDVTTTKGILGRKTGKAKKRHINVAFSPYIVQCRYWKIDADKEARIILDPFWPQWEEEKLEPGVIPDLSLATAKLHWKNTAKQDYGVLEIFDATKQRVHFAVLDEEQLKAGNMEQPWDKKYRGDALNGKFEPLFIDDSAEPTPLKKLLFKSTPYAVKVTTIKQKLKNESLKIKWEIKKTDKLKLGLLQITDAKGKLVYQKPLVKGKLTKAKHEFVWDGKYSPDIKNSKDGDEIIPEDMPYRVQVQGHTDVDEAEGLALAVMHSEVRLYVHKKTYLPKDIRYDAMSADPSMALDKGPWVPGKKPEEADGTKWFKHQLAEYGFHPGPVTDKGSTTAKYNIALKEFKRSVPADGSKVAPNFTRLELDGGKDVIENVETKTAIKTIRGTDKRKLFGDLTKVLANNDSPDLTDEEVKTKLADPKEQMIVWVDDRQYNTAQNAKDENNDPFLSGAADRTAFGLNDYRGGMVNGDAKVDTDAISIARPWIPLKANLSLLGREDSLWTDYDAAKVKISDKTQLAAINRALGPLRIDWTFDELPADVSTIDTSKYDAKDSRSRKYVAYSIYQNRAKHIRKDTKKESVYTNCTEALGGIRPSGLGGYFSTAFGAGDFSLEPWQATVENSTESITTVVHDHIFKDQKADTDLFEPLIGSAGVYFHPSRIAGDGYRVRAEVQLKKFTGYEFPNLEILEGRYPTLPQAHSAQLRVWRRSSFRGYISWTAALSGNWPGLLDGFRQMYHAAHVYFIHEGGVAKAFDVNIVFNPAIPAHQTRYKNTVKNNLTSNTLKNRPMQLRTDDIWPWGHRADLGWRKRSPVNTTFANLYKDWVSPKIITPTWRKFRAGLLLALLKEIEKQGFMRGHTFVEFDSSPAAIIEEFKCDGAPSHVYWYLYKAGGANWKADGPCPAVGCGGTLTAQGVGKNYAKGLPLPAVGVALGATWLFVPSDSETWAHEVGHHRHLQHAASAPGDEPTLHDSENNSTQNWVTRGVANVKDQHWDRMCNMSYSRKPNLCFCGKCLLRNRGWRVIGLTAPGTDVIEP